MIKAVLDTNVFISAAVKPGGLQHKIWQTLRPYRRSLLAGHLN